MYNCLSFSSSFDATQLSSFLCGPQVKPCSYKQSNSVCFLWRDSVDVCNVSVWRPVPWAQPFRPSAFDWVKVMMCLIGDLCVCSPARLMNVVPSAFFCTSTSTSCGRSSAERNIKLRRWKAMRDVEVAGRPLGFVGKVVYALTCIKAKERRL